MSSSSANNNRSRSRLTRVENRLHLLQRQHFRLRFVGVFNLIARCRSGLLLLTWCRNGLYAVADPRVGPPVAMTTSSPVSSTP